MTGSALKEHREQLLEQRTQLDLLLENVEKTIEACGGRIVMSDQDKFKGFKQKMVEGNERRYGRKHVKNTATRPWINQTSSF